jgi:tetraacyldisaccharide 4'-kinase
MRNRAEAWLRTQWYARRRPVVWLRPPAALFGAVAALRRLLYRRRILHVERLPVPVIVVGNITVGGSGKTPFVIWLCARLKAAGFRPGVVTRGYGGRARQWPCPVGADSDPALVGDEAVLLARRLGCPVWAGPDRAAAARALLADTAVDLIVSDDGLQHYALGRDLDIVMLDGGRGVGNGYLLPAGPLREPSRRLQAAALLVVKRSRKRPAEARGEALGMRLLGETAINLATGESCPLATFTKEPVHAAAGIADPGDFFAALTARGLSITPHAYADHAALKAADVVFGDRRAVLMTEKDAVKCASFATVAHWYVPVTACFEPADEDKIMRVVIATIAKKTGTANG